MRDPCQVRPDYAELDSMGHCRCVATSPKTVRRVKRQLRRRSRRNATARCRTGGEWLLAREIDAENDRDWQDHQSWIDPDPMAADRFI